MRCADLLLTLLVTLTLLVAGCTEPADDRAAGDPDTGDTGDTNETQNETAQTPITVEVGLTGAYPVTIAYDPERIEVPAGSEVTVSFTNNEDNPVPNHDWVLEGHEGNASTEVIGNGETSDVTFPAPPPGTYTFYCSVPGHRDNGMEGTFVVA